MTHWQSPYMHAYFPALNSFPSLLGDMLADAIGCLGFTWVRHLRAMLQLLASSNNEPFLLIIGCLDVHHHRRLRVQLAPNWNRWWWIGWARWSVYPPSSYTLAATAWVEESSKYGLIFLILSSLTRVRKERRQIDGFDLFFSVYTLCSYVNRSILFVRVNKRRRQPANRHSWPYWPDGRKP